MAGGSPAATTGVAISGGGFTAPAAAIRGGCGGGYARRSGCGVSAAAISGH